MQPNMSGLCRNHGPYISRLKPAREAHPPESWVCERRRRERSMAAGMPGKDPKSPCGGFKGGQPPLGLRSSPSLLTFGFSNLTPNSCSRRSASCGVV